MPHRCSVGLMPPNFLDCGYFILQCCPPGKNGEGGLNYAPEKRGVGGRIVLSCPTKGQGGCSASPMLSEDPWWDQWEKLGPLMQSKMAAILGNLTRGRSLPWTWIRRRVMKSTMVVLKGGWRGSGIIIQQALHIVKRIVLGCCVLLEERKGPVLQRHDGHRLHHSKIML